MYFRKILRIVLLTFLVILVLLASWNIRYDIPIAQLKSKYANTHSRFVEIEQMQVHYRIESKGFPLVLLHGTGASLHTWDKWVTTLEPHFQVIRVDLPAFGLTGAHPQHQYRIKDYVRFLHQFLAKIEVKNCYLAGNSLGGEIAWNYALAYPYAVKKLVLIDAAGYPNHQKRPWVFWAARTPVVNQILQYITPKFVFKNNLQQEYEDDSKITDDLITRYYELGLRAGNRAAFVARCHVEPTAQYKAISRIKIPVLVQWGEKDVWIPAAHAQKFQKDLPQAQVKVYPKVGHIPMEEIPEQTSQDALLFLEETLYP